MISVFFSNINFLFYDSNEELEKDGHKNEDLNPLPVTVYNKQDPWNDYISTVTTKKIIHPEKVSCMQ